MTKIKIEQIKLTAEENAVIFGTLLGDGHIEKRGNSYRLKIRHCLQQSDYCYWKYEKLKRLCNSEPKQVKNGKKGLYKAVYFNSKSGKFLKDFHDLFYKPIHSKTSLKIRYKKTISEKLIQNLPNSNILLAVWFLDDGHCRKDCIGGRIATDGFSLKSIIRLKNFIQIHYKIETRLVTFIHKSEQRYTISINSTNFKKFVELIKPTVSKIPSLTYKIKIS